DRDADEADDRKRNEPYEQPAPRRQERLQPPGEASAGTREQRFGAAPGGAVQVTGAAGGRLRACVGLAGGRGRRAPCLLCRLLLALLVSRGGRESAARTLLLTRHLATTQYGGGVSAKQAGRGLWARLDLVQNLTLTFDGL